MLKKLKAHLDNTSQEEFDKDWKEIVDLELDGPSFDEFMYVQSKITQDIRREKWQM